MRREIDLEMRKNFPFERTAKGVSYSYPGVRFLYPSRVKDSLCMYQLYPLKPRLRIKRHCHDYMIRILAVTRVVADSYFPKGLGVVEDYSLRGEAIPRATLYTSATK